MKKEICLAICFFAISNFHTFKALAESQVETKEFEITGIEKMSIQNGAGQVNVKSIETGKSKALVKADKRKFESGCSMTVEQRKTVLWIEVKHRTFSSSQCEVNFEITVPKSIALSVKNGSGNLSVTGLKGNLEFALGSGNVLVDAEVMQLDGKTGSGDIEIKGLTGGGDLRSGSGNMKLTYLKAPEKCTLDIKTGSGDAEISLPKGTHLKASFAAGSGRLTNEIGDTPDSSFEISMKAGSGNLHLKKL